MTLLFQNFYSENDILTGFPLCSDGSSVDAYGHPVLMMIIVSCYELTINATMGATSRLFVIKEDILSAIVQWDKNIKNS